MTDSWIDCHVHVLNGGVEELQELARTERNYGYTGSCFLSVEAMGDAAQNALGLLYKVLSPEHYAFGGLRYGGKEDFAAQARTLWELGFDGIKMIENKPTERRRLGYAQNDRRYDGLYDVAEKMDIPFLVHIGDPRDFWDPDLVPAWAVKEGYAYLGPEWPPFEELMNEAEGMLRDHPGLRVCFAHFMFLSDDRSKLRRLMDAFPGMYLDITAGTEMYRNFSSEPLEWRKFFLDYADRILYGTDNCNRVGEEELLIEETINDMERRFLCSADSFPLWGEPVQGMGLPESVVGRITTENFRHFAGPEPRPVDRERAVRYLQGELSGEGPKLSDRERTVLREVLEMIER